MQDMRRRVKNNGITLTWLAEKLSEKTGKKMRETRLQEVLRGRTETIATVMIRQTVSEYLDQVEKLNSAFFTKD